MSRRLLPLTLLGAAALCGCTPDADTLVHTYGRTPGSDGWRVQDTITLTLPPAPATATYDLSLGMRMHFDFPYEGLWVALHAHLEEPEGEWADTVFYRVTDAEGHPLTHGLTLMQREQEVGSIPLQEGQHGHLHITHIMRRELMPHVTDVGVLIKRQR